MESIDNFRGLNIALRKKNIFPKNVSREEGVHKFGHLHNPFQCTSSNFHSLQPYVESQHILCMSKFLSALTAHRETASRNLRWVLEHMAPGALLVYIDNSGGGTTELVTKVATSCCLKEVHF